MLKIYTLPEVCEILKVSKWTIYKWVKEGKIQYTRFPGNQLRFHEEELKRIING